MAKPTEDGGKGGVSGVSDEAQRIYAAYHGNASSKPSLQEVSLFT